MTRDASVEFIVRMGFAIEEDRLPRIAGHVMALLLLEEHALSADDIAERLAVSRGSVSTNVRLLQGLGIIQRVGVPGDRRDHFQVTPEPGRELLRVTAQQMRARSQMIRKSRQELGSLSPAVKRRLLGLERFYRVVGLGIGRIIEELGD